MKGCRMEGTEMIKIIFFKYGFTRSKVLTFTPPMKQTPQCKPGNPWYCTFIAHGIAPFNGLDVHLLKTVELFLNDFRYRFVQDALLKSFAPFQRPSPTAISGDASNGSREAAMSRVQ